MDFTKQRIITFSAAILLLLVLTQAVYTGLYVAKISVPRALVWGSEGVLFSLLAALAGAALVQAKNNHLGWSAIAFSAVFNLVQVSIGLTLFGAAGKAAGSVEGLAPLASGIVAFSFMVYNAAKILLGLAALVFGVSAQKTGNSALGIATALAGVIAMITNAGIMILTRGGILPSPVAGATGVVATLLLAVCLFAIAKDDQA